MCLYTAHIYVCTALHTLHYIKYVEYEFICQRLMSFSFRLTAQLYNSLLMGHNQPDHVEKDEDTGNTKSRVRAWNRLYQCMTDIHIAGSTSKLSIYSSILVYQNAIIYR